MHTAATSPPQPLAGEFVPPHYDSGYDANGNGLYDFLVVNASLRVDATDNYTVGGVLHDSNFTLFLINATSLFLDAGTHIVSLFYSGPAINASGVDGPYTVELSLWDGFGRQLDTDVHTTNTYLHTDFEAVPAEFAPPHSDSGFDTDGDGRFNSLNVKVNLTVGTAGTYLTAGLLHDAPFTLFLSSATTDTLDPGSHTVALPFPGSALNASGIDGPYLVDLSLYEITAFQFLGSDRHTTAAYSHLDFEEPPWIQSKFANTTPTIDGAISVGEWADAHEEDLSASPGNAVPALLLVMNDNDFLYVAYDAVGDVTMDSFDVASIAFDTGNDGTATNGREDEFVQGGWVVNDQGHFVYSAGGNGSGWILHDSPYNPGLPNHAGLATNWGFGSSPGAGTDHRIYEFKIPLALLGARPGDTLGFFGGSHPAPGVFDNASFGWSTWPYYTLGPIPLGSYGDLILATEVDTTAPTISITSPGEGTVVTTSSVTVLWTASDVGSGLDHFEIRVDGGAPVKRPASARSYSVTGLSDGPHTIAITAFDGAGNSQSDSVAITVDTTPPSLQIIAPSDGAAVGTATVAISWSASDAASGIDRFEIRLDGGASTVLPASATSFTYSGVTDGAHDVTLAALDQAGHSTARAVSFTVDTILPVVAITAPDEDLLNTKTVQVAWSVVEAGSGVTAIEVGLDGGPVVNVLPTATSHTFTDVADGTHTVRVTGIDAAGNRGTSTASVTVDTTDPNLAITSPASGSVLASSQVTVQFSADDATSGVDRIEIRVDGGPAQVLSAAATSHTLTGLSDGAHTVVVTVFDEAGHYETSTISLRVDSSFFSPTGPYGVGGIALLAVVIAVAVVVFLVLWRWRSRSKPPLGRTRG